MDKLGKIIELIKKYLLLLGLKGFKTSKAKLFKMKL